MSNKYRLGYAEQDRAGLSDEDFVCVSGGFGFSTPEMLKLNALIGSILSWARGGSKYPAFEQKWFTEEGLACKVLRANGGGWTKGRFRFRLEFVPDQPEVTQQKNPNSVNRKVFSKRAIANIL
ncbi:MAG: KGK domain-containing protein [Nostoc sp.]